MRFPMGLGLALVALAALAPACGSGPGPAAVGQVAVATQQPAHVAALSQPETGQPGEPLPQAAPLAEPALEDAAPLSSPTVVGASAEAAPELDSPAAGPQRPGAPAGPLLGPIGPVVRPGENALPPGAPRPRTIVLDPGHGGPNNVGAAHYDGLGRPRLAEKDSNLEMAWRVKALLEAQGYRVLLTREGDTRAIGFPPGAEPPGYRATRTDLQARTDRANALGADLFISLHSNGSTDRRQSGVEVWYSQSRPFGDRNRRLAELVLAKVVESLRGYGYPAVDRGVKDDTCFRVYRGRCFHLFVLGPGREIRRGDRLPPGRRPEDLGLSEGVEVVRTRPTLMPGVLAELLFLTNNADAAVLTDEAGRQAIAQGIAQAIGAYFGEE